MKEQLIDMTLADIQEKCEYLLTKEQLSVIRKELLNYGAAAVMDSAVQEEIFQDDNS